MKKLLLPLRNVAKNKRNTFMVIYRKPNKILHPKSVYIRTYSNIAKIPYITSLGIGKICFWGRASGRVWVLPGSIRAFFLFFSKIRDRQIKTNEQRNINQTSKVPFAVKKL